MSDHTPETNTAFLTGTISYMQFSHKAHEKCYYKAWLSIERISGHKDYLPIIVSQTLHDLPGVWQEKYIYVNGQFRSYNPCIAGKRRLILNVFALDIGIWHKETNSDDQNQIYLNGYICKNPIYRKTPKNREITELLIAVNRSHNQSDYIPCICWGRNAQATSSLSVGTRIQIWGRIQSREYFKQVNERQVKRTAYEVSVSRIES